MKQLFLVVLALLVVGAAGAPFAAARHMRTHPKRAPRIHLVPDMDNQAKYKPQASLAAFADGRAMRPPIENTVAWSPVPVDEALEAGTAGESWIEGFPKTVVVNEEFRARGTERFAIYCLPCHGVAGAGDGPVALAAKRRAEPTWVPPTVLTSPDVVARPNGHLFNTITRGIRNMPAYGSQIPVRDRWAIVAHLRDLQQSANPATPR